MSEMGWKEAIISVLTDNPEPMHYSDIAEAIAQQGLKKEFGATPANSVNATISLSIKTDGQKSPFIRLKSGWYSLKDKQLSQPTSGQEDQIVREAVDKNLIKAYGMYWRRDNVYWRAARVKILGQQPRGTKSLDFSEQKGVYLLHDGTSVVYAGRAISRTLGQRLKDHTGDRLEGRWDRFSWFGVCSFSEDAPNGTVEPKFTQDLLITTLESLLIEALEPPQNRRAGEGFLDIEFLQVTDVEIKKKQREEFLVEELKKGG